MPRLLITGSNGLVGQKLLTALKSRKGWEILAASAHPDSFHSPGFYQFERLDITEQASVQACLSRFKPEIIIHTAAMTQVDPCEKDRELCWKINAEGTRHLVQAAEALKAHFVHLSTDFIFDGTQGPYRETDTPRPVNYYGESKLEAEKIVREFCSSWCILRTILVYGVLPHLSRSNIVLFVKKNLEEGKKIRVVKDQFRMPTLAEDLAAACLSAAEKRAQGIFNVSGPELISIFDFALLIAQVFGLNDSLIEPVLSQALQEPAKRPPATGFVLDKTKNELQYRPHSLKEGLERVKNQFKEIR